jgi:HD domain
MAPLPPWVWGHHNKPYTPGLLPQATSLAIIATAMADIYELMVLIERLKEVQRRRWELRGVEHAESGGDHMYRMAVLCLVIPEVSYKNSLYGHFPY